MVSAVLLVVISAAAAAPAETTGPIPSPAEILKSVRPGHPRLLVNSAEFARLKERIASEPQLGEWRSRLERRGERILGEPPSRHEIPDGLRLLATSRRVLDRVYTLSLLYRTGGGKEHLDRVWKELEAAAQFPDWNPRHFLDTAEMTHAFAIAYDWLFDAWTADQRAVLRQAMVEKGLRLGVESYRSAPSYGWWTKSRHNWNQVCNGGIGMGALALAEEEPQLAGEFLHHALESLKLPMAQFAPDGAWDEGPGYWNYATSYNCIFLAALDSALGTDYGLSQFPGFADTGLFPISLTGPLGRTFNYADGGEATIRAPHMFWLARKFGRPAYAAYQARVASPTALDLLWFQKTAPGAGLEELPLDRHFRGVEVAVFRGRWEDRNAVFAGLKAGDNKANHSNLDLGSFILDALGQRWAVDLGADNYNLPGYFGGQRWNYYRLRAEGHNTLVINPGKEPDQDPKAAAKIIRFDSKPGRAIAIADLTPAYARHASQVKRGLALIDRHQVLVQDEVQTPQPADVWWFMHTPARVESNAGNTATLVQGDVRLAARILAPEGARFEVMDAKPLPAAPQPEGQAANQNIRKLAIHLPGVEDVRVAVLLTPLAEGSPANKPEAPKLSPLRDW